MRPTILFSACLATSSIAAPTLLRGLSDVISTLTQPIQDIEQLLDTSGTCDTSRITLPASASDLPVPDGQTPIYVAVGRGTQNYSCATSTSDSTPEAIGAVASLYNATCIAVNDPDMLATLPNTAYNIPSIDNYSSIMRAAKIDLLGHHFFQGSTPVFNLDTTPAQQYGIALTEVQKKVDAPSDSMQGDNGAVQWLYLSTINGTIGNYKSVYRVNTAGGAAPKNCENMPSVITVQYAANYYFYEEDP